MTALSALWLPILLSAVGVFLVSSILHTVLAWHRNDYPRVPNEDQVMDALRPLAIPPGDYMVPRAGSSAEMRTPEFAQKLARGPVIVMTVMAPGGFTMGKSLALWFIYSLVVSLFAAYIGATALPPGAPYLAVFRFAGTTAFLGYAAALWQMSIWYQRSWGTTLKATIDGLIYGLVTAGIFGWLWPN